MKKIIFIAAAVIMLSCPGAKAEQDKEVHGKYVFPLKTAPVSIDNYLFSVYFNNSSEICNLESYPMCRPGGDIISFKINPSGATYAIIRQKGKKSRARIYNLWSEGKEIHEIRQKGIKPDALCWSPDAKRLAISSENGYIYLYNSITLREEGIILTKNRYNNIEISSNNYFIAGAAGNLLQIWNIKTGLIRKELAFGGDINSFSFSNDGNYLSVLTENGEFIIYDTRTFISVANYDALGIAKDCAIHPENKYFAIITGDSRIAIINRMDNTDRRYFDNPEGGIAGVRFVKDGHGNLFLAYNTKSSIVYEPLEDLAPNYTDLLRDELNEKMNVWMKRMEGESLEEYNLRVNDETRMAQMRLFEQEIASRMAGDLVRSSQLSFGNYNPRTETLALEFDKMPPIYLSVPQEETVDFMNPANLEFRNERYGLTDDDKFELVYADVYNKASGKTYTFDNRERISLDYLKSDDNYVPLDLIQMSTMEEMKLQEIKENVVTAAKEKQLISNHTQISVSSDIRTDVNADGEKIMNYAVGFSYNVEKEFSAEEDFAPGDYATAQSGAAMSLLEIIRTAFNTEFKGYVKPGKEVRITITGMADNLPINGKIAYSGIYGEFYGEPVYKDDNLVSLTITKESGITTNDQLAFLRATGVKNYISDNIAELSEMDTEYVYKIKVADKSGGEHRRISIEFEFIDAF